MSKKTTRDMGIHLLCFQTKPDINGNSYTLVVDVDNKLFARNRYWGGRDFCTVSRKDFRELISKLSWIGFEEVE